MRVMQYISQYINPLVMHFIILQVTVEKYWSVFTVVTWKHECAFIPIGCARSAALSMSQCSFLVSKTHLETKEETSMALDDMLLH